MPPHAKSDWDPLDSSILSNQRRAYDQMRETYRSLTAISSVGHSSGTEMLRVSLRIQ